ncbi:MAG: hypothetical protein P8Y42_19000 [Exilibacterium sp.]
MNVEVALTTTGFQLILGENLSGNSRLRQNGLGGYDTNVAFSATSRRLVDQFYEHAMDNGGKDNGKPGLRPMYHEHYYGAFVIDPDGNNVEAVCHTPE